MNQVIANVFVLAIVIELFLLSIQAEPVTAVIGYIFGSILLLALILHTLKRPPYA